MFGLTLRPAASQEPCSGVLRAASNSDRQNETPERCRPRCMSVPAAQDAPAVPPARRSDRCPVHLHPLHRAQAPGCTGEGGRGSLQTCGVDSDGVSASPFDVRVPKFRKASSSKSVT